MNLGGWAALQRISHYQDTAAGRTQDDQKWEQNKMSWILLGYITLGLGGHVEELNHIWSSVARSWRKQERNMIWFSFSKDRSVQNVSYTNFVITQKTKHSAGRMITPQQILARRKEQEFLNSQFPELFTFLFVVGTVVKSIFVPHLLLLPEFQSCQMAI